MKRFMLWTLAVGLFAVCVLSCSSPFDSKTATEGSPTRSVSASGDVQKRVVGYFVEWGIYAAHDSYYVTSIPFDKVTHINYAFVGINPTDFSVEVYDPWASLEIVYPGESWDTPYKGNLGMLRKMKEQYPGVKVLISVGGWTKSHGFHAAAASETSRQTCANNLVAFMKQYDLDGIDIDWEYPGIDRPADPNDPYDKGAPGGPEDMINYTLFLKAIREALDAQGAADGRYYELTAAVGVGYDKIEVTDPAEYSKYLDAVLLMTYDMHGGFESVIGHQGPLYANPNDTHDPLVNERYNVDWAVQKFLDLGVPAHKLIVGVPFYSRGWNNVSGGWDVDGDGRPDGMFGTGGGSLAGKWGIGGQSPYFAIKQLENQSGWEKYRDPYSMVPWLYNRSAAELYTFDDATSVSTKMDYILQKNLGGAMFWEFDGDDWHNGNDLINIIADKMLGGSVPQDTTPPNGPASLSSLNVTSTSISISWPAATDNVGVAGYLVSWGSGSKTVTGTSTTITDLTASTTYSLSVKAFDTAGNYGSAATLSVKTGDSIVDTIPPTVPQNLAASGVTSNSINLSWSASSDNVGVTGYDVYMGGSLKTSVPSNSTTISGLAADTSYSFQIRAKDAAGNASALSSILNAKTLAGGNDGPATGVPGTPSLSQSTWNGEASYTITMNMWWGNNGTTFELYENGSLVSSKPLTDNSPNSQTTSVSFSGKANGTYSYVGKLINRFGTTSSNALSYTVTKGGGDTQAPSVPGNLAASGVTSNSVNLSWSASSDNVGVTGYVVSWSSGSQTVTGLSAAVSGLSASTAYTFSVKATDAAGNQSSAATVNVTTQSGGGDTYPAWAMNTYYAIGTKVSFQGSNYQCALSHTSYSETWNPAVAPTLWIKL